MGKFPKNDENVRIPAKCYLLIFFMLAGVLTGLYFLMKSFIDPQTEEILKFGPVLLNWNSEYPAFSNLSITLHATDGPSAELYSNNSDSWGLNLKNFPYYNRLVYTTSAVLISSNNSITKTISSNGKEYNITTNLTVSIENNATITEFTIEDVLIHSREYYPINSKLCRNNGKGFWDTLNSSCYYNYNTKEICIVIDNKFLPVAWYRRGCDNRGFIKKEAIVWATSDEFVDFTYNISVNVRSIFDPFVFASYNSLYTFSLSSKEYIIIGSVLVGVCGLVMCVPVWYWYLKNKQKKYLEMDF